MPPGLHANLGASSSKRWMSCPGSVALSAGIPDKGSVYATEGTAAHDLAEAILSGLTRESARGLVGTFHENGTEITDELLDAVEVFVDHVEETRFLIGDGTEMYLERRVELAGAPEKMFGTADVTLWNPETSTMHIIDYKHGKGVVVNAKGNTQLQYYALAACDTFGIEPLNVTMTIVQPRAGHQDGPIRSDVTSHGRLQEFREILYLAAEATQTEGAPLAAGEWCRFCKAKPVCPAQLEQARDIATIAFDVQPEPTFPAAEALTHDQMSAVLTKGKSLIAWIKSVEQYAEDQLIAGKAVPGYKLVRKRTRRRWEDAESAAYVLQSYDLEPYKETMVSPAQAEKLLKSAGVDVDELSQYIISPEGEPELAPETDKREPIINNAAAVFGELQQGN